jgi:very-short-patch-repair endonuclease
MAYLGKSVEREMYLGAKPDLFKLATEMRKNPTESEKNLWKLLRKFRAEGYIFRQQHPIDIFIADFYCHKLKLIIEVDGDVHLNDDVQQHDMGRTAELERFGIRVIRFTNQQVLNNQDLVLDLIRKYIKEISSPALLGAGDKRG